MNLLRIDNKAPSEKVSAQLMQKMITAELKPGEGISLRAIAARSSASASRRWARPLGSLRATKPSSSRTIVVNQLSTAVIDELLELRRLLEYERPKSPAAVARGSR